MWKPLSWKAWPSIRHFLKILHFKLFSFRLEYVVLLFRGKSYNFSINSAILKDLLHKCSFIIFNIFPTESNSDIIMEANEKNMIHKSTEVLLFY